MTYLKIDGSIGEGGGQMLRTALTLSILTKQPIELINIRANRKKPGLLRQHLTSVLAAKEICSAKTEGVELGADCIRFAPGDVKSGDYHFCIGTAGSTVLVCQTILPVLMLADGRSKVTFEGGTHNGMSPSLCFLEHSYLPVLKMMGVNCHVEVEKLGFYPAGGGKWQLTIEPNSSLKSIELVQAESSTLMPNKHCRIKAMLSLLPDKIGVREISAAKRELNWPDAESIIERAETPGPGNSFQLHVANSNNTNVFEVVGELGVSAETVAKRCSNRVKRFIDAAVAVEEHLADQLLLPMVLSGGGKYTTTKLSLHTTTNIEVIKQLTGKEISAIQLTDTMWEVSL